MHKILSALGLAALISSTTANATVLHCKGYQVGDRHQLTDQIITLDMTKSVVVSIGLVGKGHKDVINTPLMAKSDEFVWFYDAVRFKYVLNKDLSYLQLLSDAGNQLGIFDCVTT